MKRFAALATLSFVAAACADTGPRSAEADEAALPVQEAKLIPGQYIVILRPSAPATQIMNAVVPMPGVRVRNVYVAAVNGFAAKLSPEALAQLQADPNVAYIEQDQVMTADATQTGATWGIDRTDQRNLPLSGTYTYANTGAGVTAYIIDTGINTTHNEFGGRASVGYDAIGDGRNGIDCNGHGTHVSGTVGGVTYGIAKGVTLKAVRVLDCAGSGSNSGVIAGVDWVTVHHTGASVANMSLGGGASTALDNAVTNSINSGVTYAIAAGNSNRNACNFSPARTSSAITVGATTSTDARASYSNYGACLDLFGPGSSITSSWIGSNTATNTISGTSMATPHVAGVAALYLQSNPGASAASVRNALVANGTTGKVTSAGRNSPNVLLYSNY